MLKNLVVSSSDTLPEYRKQVHDAVKDYSDSITDLGVAIGAEILSQVDDIKKGVNGFTSRLNGNVHV
jgi:hypothetical protein